MKENKAMNTQQVDALEEKLVQVNRVAKVVKGKPITKKPLEVRMGKGKGNVEYWVALVQPGKVMFEMAGVEEELAREAFRLASAKLPIKTHFIKKDL